MTMKPMIKCANCGRMVPANPRVKNQNYCNRKACRRVRKNKRYKPFLPPNLMALLN